jgi:adenosylhomocysteine nucleosidase
MYGILCATPEELAALKATLHLEPAPQVHGPTTVWTGRHADEAIVVALAGIGKVNAAAAATLLLAVFGARTLIFAGVAGGLNPAFPVGSVLLGERLAIHDYGAISDRVFTPTAYGVIPVGAPRLEGLTPASASVRALLARLVLAVAGRLEAPPHLGGVITADYFLNCAETRDELHAAFGADAIDMESGAVAQVAGAWGVDLLVIRTLSDLAGADSHLTYGEMAAMAARNSALCVPALLEILSEDR